MKFIHFQRVFLVKIWSKGPGRPTETTHGGQVTIPDYLEFNGRHLLSAHMVSGPKSDKMGVVGRGWNGHRSRTSSKSVAQFIRDLLQVVGGEVIVIMKNVVMCWSTCTLTKKDRVTEIRHG
jgi:hypothetical protein